MVHTRSFRFYLSAGMILCIASLMGCASQMQTTKAPEPPGTAHGQVVDMKALLAAADKAFKAESYEEAQRDYALARQNAEGLSPEQADLVKTRLARIESVMHERAIAAAAKKPAPAAKPAPAKKPAAEAKMAEAPKPAAKPAAKPAEAPKAAEKPAAAKEPPAAEKTAEQKATEQKAAEMKARQSAAKKEADARAAYDAGMKAYDEKDYLTASKELQAAKDSGVDFGGFFGSRNRKLRSRLTEVDEALNKLQTAYKSAKQAYDNGDFMTAQKYLASVTERGISLGKQTDADVRKMTADIDQKIAAQRAAQKQKEEARAMAARKEAAEKARRMEAEAQKLAAQAEALLKDQKSVQDNMAAADKAMAAGDMETAKKDLMAAQKTLQDPKVAAMKPLAGASAAITAKLATIEKAMAEKKRMEAAQATLAKMVKDAQALSKTDLASAETKAQDAQAYAKAQGVSLTGQQSMVLAGVLQAAEQKFGLMRRLRRQEYAALAGLAKAKAAGGHYAKAAQLDDLVAKADPSLADAPTRAQAAKDAAADQKKADAQKQKATELAAGFAKARQALRSQGLEAGLKVRQDLIHQARQANLSTDQAVSILSHADLAFLDKDVRQAVADASKALAASSDKVLAQARARIKAAQGGQAAMPLDQRAEIQRIYNLAQAYNKAVMEGDTARIASAKQQWADATVKKDARTALHALQQGEVEAATKTLDDTPAADASEAVRKDVYEPAKAQLQAARAAQENLSAAEAALAAHDFAKADKALKAANAAQKLPAALQTKLNALAAVLNDVRGAQGTLNGYSSANNQAVASVKASLDSIKQRDAAWKAYTGAVKVLLTGSKEDAAKALGDVTGTPGLTVAERDNINRMVAGLSASGSMAKGMAQQMLATAQSLYNAGDYAGAAQALANVKASPAYGTEAALQQSTQALEQSIQAKEQEADKLYAQAVAAYKAGDKAEVGRLMAQLKSGYSHTKFYEQHR